MIGEIALLFFLPFLFGIAALRYAPRIQKHVALLLAFSGAYLFGITISHLLPEVFAYESRYLPMWVLAGFVLQLFLDFLSQGVEHGHIHAEKHLNSRVVFSILAGLSIHSLLEGIPLGSEIVSLHGGTAHAFHHSLLASIALHKMPAAFALMMIFHVCGLPLRKSVIFLFLFSAMSPLSYAGTWLLLNHAHLPAMSITPILALVAGSFMHISTTIIFEMEASGHHFNRKRMMAILAGLMLAVLPLFF